MSNLRNNMRDTSTGTRPTTLGSSLFEYILPSIVRRLILCTFLQHLHHFEDLILALRSLPYNDTRFAYVLRPGQITPIPWALSVQCTIN